MTALTALSYMKRLARDCRQNEGIRIQWGEKVFASFLISVFFNVYYTEMVQTITQIYI